jgi:hypothetical protein
VLRSGRTIRIESKKGVSLNVDTQSLQPGPKLQAGLDHLLAGGKLGELDPKDQAGLAKKKSLIGTGENALIVRFDLKVIRIDEKLPIDLGRLVKKSSASK